MHLEGAPFQTDLTPPPLPRESNTPVKATGGAVSAIFGASSSRVAGSRGPTRQAGRQPKDVTAQPQHAASCSELHQGGYRDVANG